ncbi:exopolysaccharide biosynthesis polyprenyl glycosylphosphotransferase [Actinomadura sp. SCN-SB]|uniref:exopolysaccharide biosynthesis polyprenyl glycosylphosphotransferase n=1 Tax=Actinomadura sp. SCN-SB TaxID=3373092 RepID=UPI0037527D09
MGSQGLSTPAIGLPQTVPAPRARRPRTGRLARPRVLPALFAPVLAVADASAMAVAVTLAAWPSPGAVVAVAAVVFVAFNAAGGLYRFRRAASLLDDLPALLLRSALVAALALGGIPHTTVRPAVLLWLWTTFLGCAFSGAGRVLVYAALRTHRRRRRVPRPAIVVGTGTTAAEVADLLPRHRDFGLAPAGQILAGDPDDPPVPELPVLGRPQDLPEAVRSLSAHPGGVTIVVCAEDVQRPLLEPVVRASLALPAETLLVLSTTEVLVSGGRIEHLAGLPFLRLGPRRGERAAHAVKRLFDVVAASAALLLSLPVLLACALAVRIEGGPGVLFRQRRVGRGGRQFVLLKFRSLRPDDDHEADTRWSVDGDARIGPVGRFLRTTSLDELPQLWNVIRGDMSLVGPRPERPHFVRLFSESCPEYGLRHRMPAGITGWSQVNGLRGDTSIELRARYDNRYIDTWSFGRDLKILLLTVRAVLAKDPR